MKKLLLALLILPSLCFAAAEPVWENITPPPINSSQKYVFRTSVPHGWLVVTSSSSSSGARALSTVFIPDENHEWLMQ